MIKCKSCEREIEDNFGFCPYCGREIVAEELSDEERVQKVLPILKETFSEVTTVGVDALLVKLDENKSLIVNTAEAISTLGEKIDEMNKDNEEEAGFNDYEEIRKRKLNKKRDWVRALSLICLVIGATSFVLSIALRYAGELTGHAFLADYFSKGVSVATGSLDVSSLSGVELVLSAGSVTFILALIFAFPDLVLSFVRLLTGKTKGRFYFLPVFGAVSSLISVIALNIANCASVGAYVLCISLFLRIILGFFFCRTDSEYC